MAESDRSPNSSNPHGPGAGASNANASNGAAASTASLSVTPADSEAELVAYLDGELDHVAAQRVERRLSDDPAFRRRLQQFQRAWDLLDQLPRVEATADFATTTVEMVAVRAAAESDASQHRRRRLIGYVAQAVCAVAAIVLGFLFVSARQQAPERRLLRDLPVIENVDNYLNVEDVEFVRQLARDHLFDQEPPDAPAWNRSGRR